MDLAQLRKQTVGDSKRGGHKRRAAMVLQTMWRKAKLSVSLAQTMSGLISNARCLDTSDELLSNSQRSRTEKLAARWPFRIGPPK